MYWFTEYFAELPVLPGGGGSAGVLPWWQWPMPSNFNLPWNKSKRWAHKHNRRERAKEQTLCSHLTLMRCVCSAWHNKFPVGSTQQPFLHFVLFALSIWLLRFYFPQSFYGHRARCVPKAHQPAQGCVRRVQSNVFAFTVENVMKHWTSTSNLCPHQTRACVRQRNCKTTAAPQTMAAWAPFHLQWAKCLFMLHEVADWLAGG